MLREILTVSALIVVVLLVRAMFRNRVPKLMIYALWLVVLLKLCLPGTLFSLPVLPTENVVAPAQNAELPAQTTPVVQQPAQTVTQPQTPTQQPVSPAQETAKPTTKPLTTAQILQIVWFSGSALLGLWLFGAWVVFTIRLHRDRRFLGKRGRTHIYVSGAVKSPCLAGLIPAVYLTEDVLQTDEGELIVRHELTHLRHLDFLWSFCRAAAVSVYWWNPFIWVAAICSKRDAELACDEAVAAKLPDKERIAYARAILAQAPRKAAALSLAGPPVKERILFLTKKQRTSALCVILALLLVVSATGCSFAELTQREQKPVSLTKRQIDDINAYFDGEQQALLGADGHFGVNGFFTSTYDNVQDLNLKTFLKYFREGAENDIREEEFARLKEVWPQYAEVETLSNMPVPITRYPASSVEAVLQEFAGIGLQDLKDVREPFSGYAYLEETDAFYTTTSDYAPGFFVCESGTVLGDTATLLEEDGARVLTLRHEGEHWYIQSLQDSRSQPEAEETPSPTRETEIPTQQSSTLSAPAAILIGSIDLSTMSVDALGQLLDELNELRPDDKEAENEKWAAISAVKTEQVNRAKESGYSYRESVTFEKLNEMIGYRLMNNEALMNAFPDDAAQMEACREENAAIETFRATLPENGSDEEAYAYWQKYWQDVIHQDAPSYFVPAMTLKIFDLNTSPSSEKTYTLSAEDAAAVEALFSIDSMTPAASDSESVCAYQFDIENRSYLLADSLDYIDVIVRESEDDYTYYGKHLSDTEIESLSGIIEAYAE